MKTSIQSTIKGTVPGIQDLLSSLSTFIPDCDVFQTVFGKTESGNLNLVVVADNTIISEVLEVINACDMQQIENKVKPLYSTQYEFNNNTQNNTSQS